MTLFPGSSAKGINPHRFSADNDWIRVLSFAVTSFIVAATRLPQQWRSALMIAALVTLFYLLANIGSRTRPQLSSYLQYLLLFLIFFPADLSAFVIAQACIFGLVFGEWVFGGRGYSFVHPVACGLAYLLLTNAGLDNALEPGLIIYLAMAVSIGLLAWYRCIDLMLVVMVLFPIVLIKLALPDGSAVGLPEPLVVLFFILVLCDPACTPATKSGRLVYGLLLGCLLVLFDPTFSSLRSAVLAGFFACLCAPFFDWLMINIRWRSPKRPALVEISSVTDERVPPVRTGELQ